VTGKIGVQGHDCKGKKVESKSAKDLSVFFSRLYTGIRDLLVHLNRRAFGIFGTALSGKVFAENGDED
jgi:hypothetical protein